MKKISLILSFCLTLISCQTKDDKTIKVGTIAGPETLVVKAASQTLKEKGYTLKVKEFSDYLMPNLALDEGSLDANIYQHKPYLEAAIHAKGLKITAVAKTFIYPMAAYSKKIQSLDALKHGDIVAIPNDPSNEARALLLLQQQGLITLQKDTTISTRDIKDNHLGLSIKPMDAAQLPRALEDVTLAIINTTFAIPAGLNPQKDSLCIESKDSPYANLIVVKTSERNSEKTKALVLAMKSDAVLLEAKKQFGDGAIAVN